MSKDWIIVTGAREHNLKNIDVKIPRDQLTVITGLSGSGKSSLAFDTIYAEGQRKYVESLSAYARQFLEQMQKPDVDHIEGLSPAISIEQRNAGSNPRSIVATTTEIHDYLRLLYASIGKQHCPSCRKPVTRQSAEEIVEQIINLPEKSRIMVLAPLVSGKKGEHLEIIDGARKQGFARLRVDGEIVDVEAVPKLDKKRKHSIDAVIDRLVVSDKIRTRLNDSIELALGTGEGVMTLLTEDKQTESNSKATSETTAKPAAKKTTAKKAATKKTAAKKTATKKAASKKAKKANAAPSVPGWIDTMYSENAACIPCGLSFDVLEARYFSFNSPYGACTGCAGLGAMEVMDEDLVVPEPSKSLNDGAITPWRRGGPRTIRWYKKLLAAVSDACGIDMDIPWQDLPAEQRKWLLHGTDFDLQYELYHVRRKLRYDQPFEGVLTNLLRWYNETESDSVRNRLRTYMSRRPCTGCHGARLKPQSLACTVHDTGIHEISALSIEDALQFFQDVKLSKQEGIIASEVIKEISARLSFMANVGLGYLTLNRESGTLSGGEAQRIRLATQIGSGLVGVVYVLDEPSIGLHQRDNRKLITTLQGLRDAGNTVIVVEHDEDTIRAADYVLDIGPQAGIHGGEVVFAGTAKQLTKNKKSLTAKYLNGIEMIPIPAKRNRPKRGCIEIKGAQENNLKKVNAKFPIGEFICVTGVSGSGKSTLVTNILKRAAFQYFYDSRDRPGKHKSITGLDQLDKVIEIDQSPIGRTPRSNPATYTGAFTQIRDLFSRLPQSKVRGFEPGRFSFNVKGGRCETCKGDGILRIEMHFLPDVYVPCEQCAGLRYNRETLEVRYKGKNIAEVLDMTVEESMEFFDAIPGVKRKFQTMNEVGLGYLRLGQAATTLSGGEAQRVKLSAELSKRSTGKTLYILDEPTTGLHFADVKRLLQVINKLRDAGNTVVVIEHNLDVVKTADSIIDLGPEGGAGGGTIVATGTPEKVAKTKGSHTGEFLKDILN